jgi:hypothetical protein
LTVAIFWSAIKQDYRLYMNEGTGAQVVLVPLGERLYYLTSEASKFAADDFARGFDALVSRHGYIDYLARTMETVPDLFPYENGALTAAVVQHITAPRFLFPDKPPLPSDTEVMARYTDQVFVWSENTSISIGHLAELYVDFGYMGGLCGMIMIGLGLGTVYRAILAYRSTPAFLASGLCLMTVLPAADFGIAYAKLVGAVVFCSAIAIVFQRVGAPLLLKALHVRARL